MKGHVIELSLGEGKRSTLYSSCSFMPIFLFEPFRYIFLGAKVIKALSIKMKEGLILSLDHVISSDDDAQIEI